jgi:hypothetical protein
MATPSTETSLKALVQSAVGDLQRLIKAQVELAKLELQQTGKAAGKTSGLLIGALTMAGIGGLFLLVTIAYVLVALGLPVWAGFGIVTLALFLIALVLGLLGKKSAKAIKGPEQTIAEIERTKAAVREALSGGSSPAFDEVDVIEIEARPASDS